MFDLESAIREWRRRLRAAGIKSQVVAELESHLREDVAQHEHSGLEPRQAFDVAVQRLGPVRELRVEFSKVNGAPPTRRENLLRASAVGFAALVLGIDAWTLMVYEIAPVERVGGLVAISFLTLHIATLPYWGSWFSAAAQVRMAAATKAAALLVPVWVLVALLASLALLPLPAGIAFEMFMWTLCAAVAASAAFAAIGRPQPGTRQSIGLNSGRFTPAARQSLDFARQEAARLRHDYVGTEHLLLGLLRLEQGAIPKILHHVGLVRGAVREETERLVSPGPTPTTAQTLPFTPRARKALKLAELEAATLSHPDVGAEHILLGLLLENSGVAALVLKNLKVQVDTLRAEIAKELGSGDCDGPEPAPAG